jgi:hypothetical protein
MRTRSHDPSSTSSSSPKSSKPRRRTKTGKKEMNNENISTVEIRRKSLSGEARYELAERGESRRNFEKPDKPDAFDNDQKNQFTSLSSLPPDDLRNIVVLVVLCMDCKELD